MADTTLTRLDWQQLGACVALCGVPIHDVSPVRYLPLPSPAHPPPDFQPTPDVLELVRCASNPSRVLEVSARKSGSDRRQVFAYLEGANDARVMLVPGATSCDLTPILTRDAGLANTLERLGAASLPRHPPETIVLGIAAFTALLASADAAQSACLRARLSRVPVSRPVLTVGLLEGELAKSARTADTGWAIVAAREAAPAMFDAVTGRMEEGLAALCSSGLASPMPRGFAMTERGESFVAVLSELAGFASLKATAVENGTRLERHASVFVGRGGVIAAFWSPPNVELHTGAAVNADRVASLWFPAPSGAHPLQPPAAAQRDASPSVSDPSPGPRAAPAPDVSCGACGTPARAPGQRFCVTCAAPLKPPSVEGLVR